MSQPHLSDDRLIGMYLDGTAAADRTHLLTCSICEQRRASLASTLDEVADVMVDEADAAFSDERLARQHARILQRVDQLGRPASVVDFPTGQLHRAPATPSPTTRWAGVGAAVAASFVVGLLAEHLAHDLPGQRPVTPSRVARQADVPQPALTAVSDEELLGQIELAVGRIGTGALRPLDAVTPHAWEVR